MSDVRDPFDVLIDGQYANDVQFVRQEGGLFLGPNFDLAAAPTPWTLRLGRYDGKYHNTPVNLRAYWIYKKSVNMCWQAENRGGGSLKFWNQDGHAAGSPEDFELFSFYAVDRRKRTLKIFNPSYHRYLEALNGAYNGTNDPCYVNLVGNTFMCNDSFANAAIFTARFV